MHTELRSKFVGANFFPAKNPVDARQEVVRQGGLGHQKEYKRFGGKSTLTLSCPRSQKSFVIDVRLLRRLSSLPVKNYLLVGQG